MGAQAAQEFYCFEKIGFTNPVGTNHEQTRLGQLQLQNGVVPEPLQLELVKPDGWSGGAWLRYLLRTGL